MAAGMPAPPGSSLRFRHLRIEDGLAQSSVQAIVQDPQGYMWFGTQNGLQRYDGYDFLTLRHDPDDATSLADNTVTALAVAQDGSLWVGTGSTGLDRLERGGVGFIHFRHDARDPASLGDNQVFTLYMDGDRTLWVGTGAGLDHFDGHGFQHYAVPTTHPDGRSVYSLYRDGAGRLWVGTDRGVYTLDGKMKKLQAFRPAGIADPDERGLFSDSPIHAIGEIGGALWIGSGRGIVTLDAQSRPQHFYARKASQGGLSSEHALALLQDRMGDVWVATYGGGLDHFDSGSFIAYQHDATDLGSISSDNLDTLYQDRAGLIWIGTDDSGVDIYNPRTRAFGYYRHKQGDTNSLASNLIWSLYKDLAGVMWIGTDSGLTRLDATRRHYRQYHMGERPPSRVDDDQINMVYGDTAGALWVGTNYGLYRYRPGRDDFQRYSLIGPRDDPSGDVVGTLYDDSTGRFWAATGNGLVQVSTNGVALRRFRHDPARADSLPDDSVLTICETADRRLWIGTAHGLAVFDGSHDHFDIYHPEPHDRSSLSDDYVQSCHADREGGLWVGTAEGLDHLPAGSRAFQRYFRRNGLPDDSIYSVLLDDSGGVWVSTNAGLSRLDPAGGFRNFTASDGLQGDEFNSGAAFQAPDGEFMFGGMHGVNTFYPDRVSRDALPPTVAITRFIRHGAEVPLDTPAGPLQQATVQYRENILSFEFTAFDYAAPESNEFSYRLDGFDSDWHRQRGRHTVTYTNLDPGHYLLRVRGANNDGVWSDHEARLAIEVLPPLWRAGWALLLYVVAAFVLTMMGLGVYRRFIKREHDLETEQQRRRWAEALHNLIHSVTAQRDARAIAEQLIDTLPYFIGYEQALFYAERDGELKLLASRGISPGEQDYLEHWPAHQPHTVARLKQAGTAQLLTPEEAALLVAGHARPGRQHYLAVPLPSGSGAFRLLLVGRPNRPLDGQQMEVASAMAKQVSVALDNAELIKELENLATTDGLTRLYNRRYFMERAEIEFERSRRYRRELSVFLIDADHFKTINDRHGHEAGDRALRMLAVACRDGLRHLDVLGRYGGEEFVVLLPETSAAVAQETAERLRRNIEQLHIPAAEGEIRLTVSIGIATAGAGTESVAALINEADRALYEAKRRGRNRIAAAG